MEIIRIAGFKSILITLIILVAICLAISRTNAEARVLNKYLVVSMQNDKCNFLVYQKADPYGLQGGADYNFSWIDHLFMPPEIIRAINTCEVVFVRVIPVPYHPLPDDQYILKRNYSYFPLSLAY